PDVPQVDADARHNAVLERILVDRRPVRPEVARRIDVRTAMVGHGEIHDAVAVNVAGIGKSFSVRLPDAVNDRRLARITWRAMVELAAQIDDAHCHVPPSHRCSKLYTDFCRRAVALS